MRKQKDNRTRTVPSAREANAADLAAFVDWLMEGGLPRATANTYRRDVRTAFERAGGLIERINDRGLAPKTRHRIKASGRQWAEFVDDTDLAKQLKRIRLPASKRKSAKTPLVKAELHTLVDAIDTADFLSKPMRAVLSLMARRGLRCGDVLRIRRDELLEAKEVGVLSFEGKGARRLEFKLNRNFRAPITALAQEDGQWEVVDELIVSHADPRDDDEEGDVEDRRRKAAARAVSRALVRVGVRCGIFRLHPHRLRRTYAVEYLRQREGDPEALMRLTQHMQWASHATALEYVDHIRGDDLDEAAERIFDR